MSRGNLEYCCTIVGLTFSVEVTLLSIVNNYFQKKMCYIDIAIDWTYQSSSQVCVQADTGDNLVTASH